jgi:hypothetical protein
MARDDDDGTGIRMRGKTAARANRNFIEGFKNGMELEADRIEADDNKVIRERHRRSIKELLAQAFTKQGISLIFSSIWLYVKAFFHQS